MTRSIASARVATQNMPYSLRILQATGNGVVATTPAAVNNLTTATFGGWFYLYSYGNGNLGRLFYKGSNASPSAYFDLYQGANNLLNFFAGWTTQGQWKTTVSLIGGWHHIMVSYDSSSISNIPVMYIDGVAYPVTTVQAPVGTRSADTTALNLLSAGFSTARYGNAAVARFRIFNRILSAAEVAALYQSGTAPSGQVLDWPFGEGSGNTITDVSGNGVVGTITGAAWMTNAPSKLRNQIAAPRTTVVSRQAV